MNTVHQFVDERALDETARILHEHSFPRRSGDIRQAQRNLVELAIRRSPLVETASELVVMTTLAVYMGANGPSVATLSQETRLSARTVQRVLRACRLKRLLIPIPGPVPYAFDPELFAGLLAERNEP